MPREEATLPYLIEDSRSLLEYIRELAEETELQYNTRQVVVTGRQSKIRKMSSCEQTRITGMPLLCTTN